MNHLQTMKLRIYEKKPQNKVKVKNGLLELEKDFKPINVSIDDMDNSEEK